LSSLSLFPFSLSLFSLFFSLIPSSPPECFSFFLCVSLFRPLRVSYPLFRLRFHHLVRRHCAIRIATSSSQESLFGPRERVSRENCLRVTGISVEHGTQRFLECRLSVREVLSVKTCGVNVGSPRWRTAAGARYPRVLPRCTVLYFREYPSILESVSRSSLRSLASIFEMPLMSVIRSTRNECDPHADNCVRFSIKISAAQNIQPFSSRDHKDRTCE